MYLAQQSMKVLQDKGGEEGMQVCLLCSKIKKEYKIFLTQNFYCAIMEDALLW